MKKKRSLILFLSLGLIIALVFLMDEQQNTAVKTVEIQLDDNKLTDEIFIESFTTQEPLSIIYTDVIFGESDQTEFEKYLDEEKPLQQTATPTFTLETSASILSPTGEIVSKSSFLNVPLVPAILVDDKENVLAGSSQIRFFGKTTEEVEVSVEGTAEFWLDDKRIATKKIFVKPDGTKRKTTELFLADQIQNTITSQVPKDFTFKFTDEQFDDRSSHTYNVIITEISVQTIDNERKNYNWSGEYLAYSLNIAVDKSLMTITDEK